MPENSPERPTFRARGAVGLAALALIVPVAAGCGGGGGGNGTGTDGKASTDEAKTRTAPGPRPGPPPKPGSVIKNLRVDVASKTQAKVTLTLGKAADLTMQVRRVVDGKPQKVGRVQMGQKPAGSVSYNWNLKVNDKQLTAGRYEVQVRGKGGAGKSLPATITVP